MGEPVKVHDLFARKPDLTLEQFASYWSSSHAELACTFTQIKHYVQSHRSADQQPVAELGPTWPDGCAETWYDDLASLEEMVATPRFSAELMVDETKFMNLGNPRPLLVSRERLVDENGFDPENRGVKLLIFAARPTGTSREDFLAAWSTEEDAALGRRLGATRQIVWAPVTEGGVLIQKDLDSGDDGKDSGGGSYDGVRELWWEDEEAMASATAADNDEGRGRLRLDEIDPRRSMALPARERVIVP